MIYIGSEGNRKKADEFNWPEGCDDKSWNKLRVKDESGAAQLTRAESTSGIPKVTGRDSDCIFGEIECW